MNGNAATWDDRDAKRVVALGGTLVLVFVFIRTAWMSDDAYITFRTVYNLLHGYGPRWNVSDRVQTFTHPLWMLVTAAATAVTGEAYFTGTFLCVGVSAGAVFLLARRAASSTLTALVVLSVLALSKSFVEFSTSGLENGLTHLLLVTFFLRLFAPAHDERRRVFWLALIASSIMLNRLDAGLLVLPALTVAVWRAGVKRVWLAVVIALLPLAAWELFSIVYYGFPFPNTAYAKLNTGIPRPELIEQGALYILNSIANDPVTLLVLLASWVAALVEPDSGIVIPAGVALYLVYVVGAGGDFMSGRFLSAPLVCSIVHLARIRFSRTTPEWALAMALLWVIGLGAPRPALLSDATFGADISSDLAASAAIPGSHVTDERRFYYPFTGLLTAHRGVAMPNHRWFRLGMEARVAGERVHFTDAAGFPGYAAGPSVHYVDHWALGDALLARLPAEVPWQVGHYGRKVPDGYLESVAAGHDLIRDPAVALYYDRLRIITEGPLWSWERFRTMYRMNMGRYERFIANYGISHLPLASVSTPRSAGDDWNRAGNVLIDRGLELSVGQPTSAAGIELSVSNNDGYRVALERNGREVFATSIEGRWNLDGRLATHTVPMPPTVQFDAILIRPTAGDARYSLGHLRLVGEGSR